MPKTYTTLTSVATGDVLTATNFNNLQTTLNNHTVPPMCRAYATATQSVANTTTTTITLNAESFDTDSMHDNVTNNSRITINTAGVYLIACQLTYDISSAGIRDSYILLNGTTRIAEGTVANAGSGSYTQMNVAAVYEFAAADYVQMIAFQNSGGALNMRGDVSNGVWMSATWIGKTS